jgi:hypothetical protein
VRDEACDDFLAVPGHSGQNGRVDSSFFTFFTE